MSELWLNSPVGYPYAEKVRKSDTQGLKRFMLQITAGNKEMEQSVRDSTHLEIVKMLEDSKFTFDPEWYGARQLPMNASGTQRSALDDPYYRQRIGIIDRSL